MTQTFSKPYYILKGQNYCRYLALVFLTSLTILSVYSIKLVGYILLPIILATIFGLLNIRFPRLLLYENKYVIEKRGIIKQLNNYETFNFEDITSVTYSEGSTNWFQLIFQTLSGQAGYGGFSKADEMIIQFTNGKKRVFNRFGSRQNFKNIITEINKKCPATNSQELKHGAVGSS